MAPPPLITKTDEVHKKAKLPMVCRTWTADCQETNVSSEITGFREPRLPREMLDKCIEPNKRCYLHVFLKSDGKLRNFPYFDKAPRCRCAIGPGESVKHCGIEHEYRTGHMVTQKPLWSLSQVHRDETIEKATPKPIDPKRPEYIFEMLNNSNCSEVEDMNQDNLLAVAKEALRNVSHLILIDGEEDLPIGCEVCFQRAIWETGAFAFGRRDRLPREAMVDEYDEHDPTRHVRGRRGGQRFIVYGISSLVALDLCK